MERLHSHLFLLRILERELTKQWNYLQNGQVDLAVSIFRNLSRTRRYLERLPPIPGEDPDLQKILRHCIETNDRIEAGLEAEARELSRAIFRLSADQQIENYLKNN